MHTLVVLKKSKQNILGLKTYFGYITAYEININSVRQFCNPKCILPRQVRTSGTKQPLIITTVLFDVYMDP